jgi:TonB family protein
MAVRKLALFKSRWIASDSADSVSKSYMTRLVAAWCCVVGVYVFRAPGVVFAQCGSANLGLDLTFQQESVTLVFVGRATSVQHSGSTEAVVFDVERVWKGDVKERTTIYRPIPTAGRSSEPPVIFDRGQRYVVIAHHLNATERRDLGIEHREDTFGTDMCGDGSRPVSAVGPDLGRLGPGRGPVDQQMVVRNPKVTPLIRTKSVAPVYPEGTRAGGIRATVLVEITVDETGRVTHATVLRSLPLLDQAAIDCVMKWEFLPALIYGRPVPMIMTVTVAFAP